MEIATPTVEKRRELERVAAVEVATLHEIESMEDDDRPPPPGRNRGWREANERRAALLVAIRAGCTVKEACLSVGVSTFTYSSYRARFPKWAAKVDVARQEALTGKKVNWDGSIASFMGTFFGHRLTWFQLLWHQERAAIPLGNVLMALWPPGHGKTTSFEDEASMQLALDPSLRYLVASENRDIASKIVGRVRNRMEPMGPVPRYVERFGPFAPQYGSGGRQTQPWTDIKFRVFKAREFDERNFSMEAVGQQGSIVSARCNRLHLDDVQSTKTLAQSKKISTWIRQDALSRPKDEGTTTISGTRVGEDDVYGELLGDDDWDDIMKVLKFPAIVTDNTTGEERPLWEKEDPDDPKSPGFTIEQLDKERRKYGQEAWDRNWMQEPDRSTHGKGTFNTELTGMCLDPEMSLEHLCGEHRMDLVDGEKPIVYVTVDPALGGKNCVMALELDPEGRLIVRRIVEDEGFTRNEQIMDRIEQVVRWCNQTAMVTDVIIETKNFQLGLARDERLEEMSMHYGFSLQDHLTGWNKYDPDIGVPSMATSFRKREIVMPYAPDDYTRKEIDELRRQLHKWQPGARGSKLRQDRVMALWFGWIVWRSRWKPTNDAARDPSNWRREGLPWRSMESGLILPAGFRP